MSKKKIHSGFDTRGYFYTACSECVRGGNGDQSCSAGWQVKRYHGEMCFNGKPLPEVQKILMNPKRKLK